MSNNIVNNLQQHPELNSEFKFRSIFVDTKDDIKNAMSNESFVVFDKELTIVSFNTDKYPYASYQNMTGLNELQMNITKLSSSSNDDFNS